MNKRLIAERFSKAITTYPKEANVQRQIAGKMIRLLTEHIPSPCSKVITLPDGGLGAAYGSKYRFRSQIQLLSNR